MPIIIGAIHQAMATKHTAECSEASKTSAGDGFRDGRGGKRIAHVAGKNQASSGAGNKRETEV